jgi:HEAT repeat protein
MRYFCPKCWSDFAEDVTCCPRCGQDIPAFWRDKDYVEKLIAALDHREPETPIRAAWILGRMGDERAVTSLIRLLGRTQDVYAAREAVEALAKVGSPLALRQGNPLRQKATLRG